MLTVRHSIALSGCRRRGTARRPAGFRDRPGGDGNRRKPAGGRSWNGTCTRTRATGSARKPPSGGRTDRRTRDTPSTTAYGGTADAVVHRPRFTPPSAGTPPNPHAPQPGLSASGPPWPSATTGPVTGRRGGSGQPASRWRNRCGPSTFDANPNIDPATIHTLASCEWIKKSQPLCLIGDSGTGKSHMLFAPVSICSASTNSAAWNSTAMAPSSSSRC
ncbi:ATP-binding protein [Streptomyces yangpuensis]|uniref:ATP-binding protein n=1 Tax=Streptomyces yangpuensis TaxID=1648182 RepID=UPI0035D631A7